MVSDLGRPSTFKGGVSRPYLKVDVTNAIEEDTVWCELTEKLGCLIETGMVYLIGQIDRPGVAGAVLKKLCN